MANNYDFLDAYSSVKTASTSEVAGAHQPIVQINSALGAIPVSFSGSPSISGAITILGTSSVLNYVTRNDTIASFLGVDLTTRPLASDSAGRLIIKPFAPTEALTYGVSSTVNTNRSSLLGLSGTGLRNYITDILIANTGSVTTLVSFSDSNGSIIGKTIAPATSGSNVHLFTPMRTGSLNSQVEFIATTATSILHVSGYGFIAP